MNATKKDTEALAGSIPSSMPDAMCVRVLAYCLLHTRLSIPALPYKTVLIFWQKDFRRSVDYKADKITGLRDEKFIYDRTFVKIANMVALFDCESTELREAVEKAGGEEMSLLITFSLLYAEMYSKLLEFLQSMSLGDDMGTHPAFFTAKVIGLYRTGSLKEATLSVFKMFNAACEKGWTKVDEQFVYLSCHFPEKELENSFEERDPTIYLMNVESSAQLASYLLYNLLQATADDKFMNRNTYYATLILLSQVDFQSSGRLLYDTIISDRLIHVEFRCPSLLQNVSCDYIIEDFSQLIKCRKDAFIVTSEQEQRTGITTRSKEKTQMCPITKTLLERLAVKKLPLFSSLQKFFRENWMELMKTLGQKNEPCVIDEVAVPEETIQEEKLESDLSHEEASDRSSITAETQLSYSTSGAPQQMIST